MILTKDFNGDGKQDMAVLVSTGITILLGAGDGTFTTKGTFSVGTGLVPTFMASGDFNNDGKTDIAVECRDSNYNGTVVLLTGNADGTFSAPGASIFSLSLSSSAATSSMAVGDFNLDGNADLAIFDYQNSRIVFFTGDGAGAFTNAAFLAAPNLQSMVIADFNNDGKPDLAWTEFSPDSPNDQLVSNLQFFLGNGDLTFNAWGTTITFCCNSSSLVKGDFNNDGREDIAITYLYVGSTENTFSPGGGNYRSIYSQILLNHGDGTFVAATGAPLPGGEYQGISTFNPTYYQTIGDFNGDGKADLAVMANLEVVTGSLFIFVGNGDGTITDSTLMPALSLTTDASQGISAADFTGNGNSSPAYSSNIPNNVSLNRLTADPELLNNLQQLCSRRHRNP